MRLRRSVLLLSCLAAFGVLFASCAGGDDSSTGSGQVDSGGDDAAGDDDSADDDAPSDDDAGDDTADDDAADDTTGDDATDDDAADDDAADDDGPLSIGDPVPDFELQASDGSIFRLSDHLGRMVLLSTAPQANTAVCSIQMKKLDTVYYDDFVSREVDPFGMSADSHETQVEWAANCELTNVLLLADHDPRGAVGTTFSMYVESLGMEQRGNILIDETGVFVFLQVTPMSEVPYFDAVLDWIDANV